MAKVKILKKLPKQKKYKRKEKSINNTTAPETNKFKDNYFKFYDDIKHPTHQRYDW